MRAHGGAGGALGVAAYRPFGAEEVRGGAALRPEEVGTREGGAAGGVGRLRTTATEGGRLGGGRAVKRGVETRAR